MTIKVTRQISSPHVQAIIDYWRRIRGDRPAPDITDVDPVAIPRNSIHYVILSDLERDPFRIKYRLVGSASADLFTDYRGKYLDELGLPEGLDKVLTDDYRTAAETLQPVAGSYPWPKKYGRPATIDYALLPLLRDGQVIRFLCVEHVMMKGSTERLQSDDLVEIPDR